MNGRAVSLLDGIGDAELARVAAAVLEVADAAPIGVVRADAILSPHGEPRTTGIVKVSGTAAGCGAGARLVGGRKDRRFQRSPRPDELLGAP